MELSGCLTRIEQGSCTVTSPSGRAASRLPSPLRTGRDSFPSPSSSPSNASIEETRFRDGKTLAMNPVMALRMKENTVFGTARTTQYPGDAVMQAPAGDPSDFGVAHRAESVLFMPEIAKCASTPERIQHMGPFAIFEVGFIHWVVRVGFAFNLDVSFDGSALGVVQPDLTWPSFVIADFTEEGPVTVPTPRKVFRFEPA